MNKNYFRPYYFFCAQLYFINFIIKKNKLQIDFIFNLLIILTIFINNLKLKK